MNSLKPASASRFSAGARAGKNFHVLGPVQIIFFRDQRAVAVEKNSPVHSGKLWLDCGKNGIEFFPAPAHPAGVHVFNQLNNIKHSHEQRQIGNFGRRRAGAGHSTASSRRPPLKASTRATKSSASATASNIWRRATRTQIKPLAIRDVTGHPSQGRLDSRHRAHESDQVRGAHEKSFHGVRTSSASPRS